MARRTKEDAIATRNSLIDAAEGFAKKGGTGLAERDIAQAAGATRGAFTGTSRTRWISLAP